MELKQPSVSAMLGSLSSYEITEWMAFLKWRDLNESKNNESRNQDPNSRPVREEEIVYDELLPAGLFE